MSRIPERYRQSSMGVMDSLFRKCLAGSSALGVVVLLVILIAPPMPEKEKTVDEIPERLAKLIIQKPEKKPERLAGPESLDVQEDIAQAEPEPPKPAPKPKPRPKPRRTETKKPEPDKGKVGRERAKKEVTDKLAQTTQKVEKALDKLSASLATSETSTSTTSKPKRRRGRVRSGRSSDDVRTVAVGTSESGASADLASSKLDGELIAIETLTTADDGGVEGGTGTSDGAMGAGPGVFRSTSSLLAVVRKYAPGIQFCYENELKRDPALQGKLIVTISVAPGGEVADASIAQDTVRSQRLLDCALAQINDWKFPPISEGLTTFRAPFVFTPPKNGRVAAR